MTADHDPSNPLTDPNAPPETLIWMADLMASLELEETQTRTEHGDAGNDTDTEEDDDIVETAEAFDLVRQTEIAATELEDEAGVFEALFGWLIDIFAAFFGPQDEDNADEDPVVSDEPIADVSEDLIFNAIEPGDDFEFPEEDPMEDDLDLVI